MATVTVHIATVQKPAAATAFDHFRILLRRTDASQSVIQDVHTTSTTVVLPADVVDGTYFMDVRDTDVFGAQLGGEVLSAPFVVGVGTPPDPTPVPFQGVNAVTVTVS